jgi:trk system potassium uptake protein
MKIIVMGCGRVGEQVSRLLDAEGNDVTVIDYDQAALDRLQVGFKGRTVRGIGFDRNVLVEAGIESADAFAATSISDNVNIIAARIARNIFSVPRAVARMYDPRRAGIYQRLGLITISATVWGAERIRELITHSELDPVFTFGNGEVCVVSIETPPHLVGRRVKDLTIGGEMLVVSITRLNQAFIPLLGTELQENDLLHVVVLAGSMERFKSFIGLGEGG